MKIADADILIVPGWTNSGPAHWQSRWQEKMRTARRVEQDDWFKPVLTDWVERLAQAVSGAEKPVVLVAHSLGVLTVAHAAPLFGAGRVAGAFLVALPAPGTVAGLADVDPAFAAVPKTRLPFPSLVVASSSDPYCPLPEAERLAALWGADVTHAGEAGHINSDSGHGPWPEGMMRFAGFMAGL